MTEQRLSLGINVSILIILAIFGVLLSLPLRMLLDTNYHTRDDADNGTGSAVADAEVEASVDFRKLEKCPRFDYRQRFVSAYRCDYDRNCTYARPLAVGSTALDVLGASGQGETAGRCETRTVFERKLADDGEDASRARKGKSVPIAGHILGTMLMISAVAALVEVIRVRFGKDKNKGSPGGGAATPRRASAIDPPTQRRFVTREPVRSQRSFEMQGMHRSALRLLGARPPPLIRRSSFPTQPSTQTVSSVAGTPSRTSRRQSAESDEEIGVLISALHHRTRLIRRH